MRYPCDETRRNLMMREIVAECLVGEERAEREGEERRNYAEEGLNDTYNDDDGKGRAEGEREREREES